MTQTFPDIHYDLLSRREKRAYKRWLAANDMWDGAEIVERGKREGLINTDNE